MCGVSINSSPTPCRRPIINNAINNAMSRPECQPGRPHPLIDDILQPVARTASADQGEAAHFRALAPDIGVVTPAKENMRGEGKLFVNQEDGTNIANSHKE
jgi:hypothetical protein